MISGLATLAGDRSQSPYQVICAKPASARNAASSAWLMMRSVWGASRIHGELLKLGIEIAESTVAKYMIKRPRRPGQSWRTFLRNHADGIAAVDFLIVPTIGFKLLYCLVLLAHSRRQLMYYAVTAYPTAEWLAQQIVEAFPWDERPRYLVRDRDAVYGEVVKRRLRGLGIRDRPIAPRSPWQKAYVERLIGSARRECIDHVIVLGEGHLRRIMSTYATYYNESRTHLSLGKDAPIGRAIERFGRIVAQPMVGGLHHRYTRIQFSVGTGTSSPISPFLRAPTTSCCCSARWPEASRERSDRDLRV